MVIAGQAASAFIIVMSSSTPEHLAARHLFGVMLRTARLGRGMSQEQLGRLAEVHQTVISRVELGRPVGVRFSALLRLIDVLDLEAIEPVFADTWARYSRD